MVSELVTDTGVAFELQNCSLIKSRIDYLGRITRPGRLEVASHTADATANLNENYSH